MFLNRLQFRSMVILKKIRLIVLVLLLLSTKFAVAQNKGNREISYGLFGGAIYSSMSNLPDVIVPKGVYEGYSLKEKSKFGGAGGFFTNWKYPLVNAGFQLEAFYTGQGTDLNYKDVNGLKYKMTFDYSYISVGMHFKYYLLERIYFGLGPYVGFNISSDKIEYTSNAQEMFGDAGVYFEPDENVQKVLQQSLTGRNYFYGLLCAGYEFKSNFSVNARYTMGITDALTTEENGHRFRENKNNVNGFSLTIGYAFYFDKLPYFRRRS